MSNELDAALEDLLRSAAPRMSDAASERLRASVLGDVRAAALPIRRRWLMRVALAGTLAAAVFSSASFAVASAEPGAALYPTKAFLMRAGSALAKSLPRILRITPSDDPVEPLRKRGSESRTQTTTTTPSPNASTRHRARRAKIAHGGPPPSATGPAGASGGSPSGGASAPMKTSVPPPPHGASGNGGGQDSSGGGSGSTGGSGGGAGVGPGGAGPAPGPGGGSGNGPTPQSAGGATKGGATVLIGAPAGGGTPSP